MQMDVSDIEMKKEGDFNSPVHFNNFTEQTVSSPNGKEVEQNNNSGLLPEINIPIDTIEVNPTANIPLSGDLDRPSQNLDNNQTNNFSSSSNVVDLIDYQSNVSNNNSYNSLAAAPPTQKTISKDPPPAAEPASWQIPPSALQQKKPLKSMQFEKYENRISKNVYDTEAWLGLLTEVQARADIDKVREVFERFLQKFPTSSRQWVQYAEYELKHENFDKVEAIFARCLRSVLSVDLWKFYLNYVRRMNPIEKGSTTSSQARATIAKAYEYVLNHIGLDKDAGTLWSDYLFFLKTGETHSAWEEQQKMDIMRKTYQRAICIPLNNVEHIWKEYDQFENALNKVTAKKFLQDRSPSYMTARTAVKEMRRFTDKINKNIIPTPPKWVKSEKEQLSYWKEWIEWEMLNPLSLEDQSALSQRIIYAYKQAMMFEAANYWVTIKKDDDAVSLLKTAMEVIPTSFLVHFAYAELQEHRKQFAETRKAYESLLSNVQTQIEESEKSTADEINALMKTSSADSVSEDENTLDLDGETREQLRIKEKELERERTKIEESRRHEIDELSRAYSLVWIMLMRFTRRIEGIKSARLIFSKARKSNYCTYHVFVASALMEYHCSKDQAIAGKIFELGLKNFIYSPEYVSQYLDFLIQLNDDNNTRALFERTLMSMPADKAKIVWEQFSKYENNYGDLSVIRKIDERRAKVYPEESFLSRFAERYSFLDTNIIFQREVGPKPDPETIDSLPSEVQNEEEHEVIPTRRALLDSVHPEKYPRPDFRQWVLYKPTAEQLRRPFFPPPVSSGQPAPTQAGGSIQPLGPSPPLGTQPLGVTPQPLGSRGHSPPAPITAQPVSLNWTCVNGVMLPEAIAKFLSILPSASSYNGPIINPIDLMDIIRNSIPTQSNTTISGSGLLNAPLAQHSLQSQPRDRSRGGSPARGDGRGYGNDGRYDGPRGFDRPLENGRGRARQGEFFGKQMRGPNPLSRGLQFKRRRREFDAETEDFQGRGGPGINRPPDYDLFRARQQKKAKHGSYGTNPNATVSSNDV
ncbi:4181_t:CDS:10 [Dentiscutata erythropus]|uniref:4181_t:CDS:1 n=1 Tax=Dentiscutata erythropus TaxID=1348616 RepID=A0A9N9DQI9_9GLOM|nr:4181_t:CDS:10 [Dentiscutata erythropus]